MKGRDLEEFHAPGKTRGDTRSQHSCLNLKIIQGDTDSRYPEPILHCTPHGGFLYDITHPDYESRSLENLMRCTASQVRLAII